MSSKSADGAPVLLLNMGQPPRFANGERFIPESAARSYGGIPADPEKVAGKTRVRAGRGRFSADGARALARSRAKPILAPSRDGSSPMLCGSDASATASAINGRPPSGPDHAGRGKGGCGALPSVFHAARRNPEMRTNGASRYKGVGSRRAAPSSPCASSWPRRSVCPCCPWLASPRSIQRRAPA